MDGESVTDRNRRWPCFIDDGAPAQTPRGGDGNLSSKKAFTSRGKLTGKGWSFSNSGKSGVFGVWIIALRKGLGDELSAARKCLWNIRPDVPSAMAW